MYLQPRFLFVFVLSYRRGISRYTTDKSKNISSEAVLFISRNLNAVAVCNISCLTITTALLSTFCENADSITFVEEQ